MALIDEYKQAIQDVLDGRAKPAPKPSELPWTEDKLASMWAAAAAELIAEANGGDALPDDPSADGTYALQNTVEDGESTLSWASGSSGGGVLVVTDTDGTLDKTWQEIADAGFAILRIESDIGITCSINHSVHDGYYVTFAMLLPNGSGFDNPLGYTASTANGYPAVQS